MRVILYAAIVGCACAFDIDTQSVKSVKGGHGGFNYQGGDVSRFFNNGSSYGGFNASHAAGNRPGHTQPIDFEVGVCYVEVPTASLVRDNKVPAGNGSRPDLSRIRTCCKGYTRNVYNFKICEPVCSPECSNGLCTAPDTCTCFPDHVRNHEGACVATCPIGCQNGRCDGGECMCKEGFSLDVNGKFCVPNCRHRCGGQGICTAPNTCKCNPGFKPTLDGACQVDCGKCDNGDCLSPTECRCRPGFIKDNSGQCAPHCSQPCAPNSRCVGPDTCSSSPLPGQGATNQTQNPQQPYPQNPLQNITFNYDPNPGSNYPLRPFNQNGPQPPNQGQHPNPTYIHINPNQPQQGSNYPQTDPNHPQYSSNYPYPSPNQNQQGSNYPFPSPNQPQHGSNHSQSNPNQPQQGSGYPHSNPNHPQQGSDYPQPNPIYQTQGNYPQYPYGQYPQQNPSFDQNNPQQQVNSNPNQPNQGSYHPITQNINVTYPQYPLYPDSQVKPNGTSQPGQQYPQYPGNQRPNPYPYYPSNGYPSPYNHNPYEQQTHEQTHESELCSVPCVNGQCIDYNRCRCNPGYITDEMDPFGARCRPHCPGGCPNGYCAAPHSCACDEGYFKDSSVKGRAVCVKRIRRSLHQLVFNIPDDE